MSKIVIGIHGLGNKPPKELLTKWWKLSIMEGLKKYNHPVSNFNFEMVYWADILHKQPLDPNETNNKSPLYLEEKYLPEQAYKFSEPMSFRKKALEYLEKYYDKILVNGIMSLDSISLTELFIHRHFRDLEAYYSSETVSYNGSKCLAKELMIERLADTLKKHKKKKILLIAHSMGTIIAHDTLIEYLPEIEIDTLITIGSPLGQKYVIHKFQTEQKNNSTIKLIVPENIKRNWYNLADLEDQVAINNTLSNLYKENSSKIKVTDGLVQNNYVISGNRNPHKSYGYLRTPEFAEIIYTYLTYGRPKAYTWIREKLHGIFNT